MSIDEVRRAVAAAHSRITSLRAEYETRSDDAVAQGAYLRGTVAAKGESRYVALLHVSPGRIAEDPNEFMSFYDGRWWNVYFPYRRRYETSRRFAVHPHTAKARAHPFFECLSWWPADDVSERPRFLHLGNRSLFLADVLASDECRVLPHQELVSGRLCHVVELPERDKLWIDAGRGILLRRQLMIRAAGRSRLIAEYELSDYRRHHDGIWLPHRIRRLTPQTERTLSYQVVAYQVNQVSDDLFDFVPPAGAIVYDRDTDTWRQVPDGLSHLDDVARRARAFAAEPAKSHRKWSSGIAARLPSTIVATFGIGVAAYLVVASARRAALPCWKKSRGASGSSTR
ncbi:MAG: hypothetical protein ACREHD_22050 [Pirellulales bacterium]